MKENLIVLLPVVGKGERIFQISRQKSLLGVVAKNRPMGGWRRMDDLVNTWKDERRVEVTVRPDEVSEGGVLTWRIPLPRIEVCNLEGGEQRQVEWACQNH
jgi:hypothetical protein